MNRTIVLTKPVPVIKLICILLCAFMLNACIPKQATITRKEMPFEKYGFERTAITKNSFEFLMGNGEMGGRLHLYGLGFEKLWFADYWKNPKQRQFLPGLWLRNDSLYCQQPNSYHSKLDIATATASTEISFVNGCAYTSQVVISFDNPNLMALKIVNTGTQALAFDVIVPADSFLVESSGKELHGQAVPATAYNKAAWALKSNIDLSLSKHGWKILIAPKGEAEFFYSVTTQYDSDNYDAECTAIVDSASDFATIQQQHLNRWTQIRSQTASVILPESDYAKWFYRSIYINYATAGSEKFLPAETQFAYPETDWDMHPFTYGHGIWSIFSFIQMGDSARAKRSLQWLYQPASLKENVHLLIPDTGNIKFIYQQQPVDDARYLDHYPEGAFAFAHEQTDKGLNITYPDDGHWDLQFHLDGFACAAFHRYAKYYNDTVFEKEVVLPVLQGTGILWKALLKTKPGVNGYYLPPMLSLSENIVKPSVLDAVLAAKWNLQTAGEYEEKYKAVPNHDFKTLAEQIYIPQNDSIYLEYLNDTQKREGGGYFGIRACAYLGFPLDEQIEKIDKTKARKTLDLAWQRNNKGKGMITFISNWFALTESYLGNGDLALERSKNALVCADESDTQIYEAFAYGGDSIRERFNPYFLTGCSSLSLVAPSMMLQSYSGTLYFFPAVPSTWSNIAFYDLPAEGGYKVSGVYKSKNDFTVCIKKNGKVVKQFSNTHQCTVRSLEGGE